MAWRCRACGDGFMERLLVWFVNRRCVIMVNVILPDHDHDVPIIEPNQHDVVLVFPKPVVEIEYEDPKEDELKEERRSYKKIRRYRGSTMEEDENKPELTYPYEEVDPLNPPPPASESELDNEIEVENLN
ncbi:hypothetical protein Tco_0059407 [Tanacetum coccineum]